MNFMDSLRKGLDRAGFEADKLMRYNRVRSEAGRLQQQAGDQVRLLGEKVLTLYKAGTLRDADLQVLAREIVDLQDRVQQKEDEATAIQAEGWVEPADPPAHPAHGSSTPPAPSYTPPSYPPAPPPAYPPPSAPPAYPPAPPHKLDDQGTRRVPAATSGPDYCPTCGAQLRPNAAFCAQCGNRV
ncbi:MAG TPA: zinc ribbon domain-containing protein [Chloroflexia bacterium]|nr:zinc ribbon domain-containing protein [Chloroflexia bacterium]